MEIGTGEVRLGKLMAMDPRGGQVELPGEHVREPAFGLPATWIDESPARRGGVPRLHHGRSGDGADHAPDRDPQGQHAGPAVVRRGAEAAEGPHGRREEAGRGPDPVGRHRQHGAAGAAGAAARAGLDPRPADHPRRHRRGRAAHRLDRQPGRAGPRPARPADLLGQPRRRRLAADHHPVARLGDRLRRGPDRPGRRQAVGAGAVASCRSSSARCARPSSGRPCRARARCC